MTPCLVEGQNAQMEKIKRKKKVPKPIIIIFFHTSMN
jgi:hypothetical protein